MEFKPWHIIIVGIIAQTIVEIIFPSEYVLREIITFPETRLSFVGIYSLFIDLVISSSLVVLLLFYEKTRKLGTFLCIFFALISLNNHIILDIFFVFAGLYSIKKYNFLSLSSIKSYQVAFFGVLAQGFIVPAIESARNGNSSHGSATLSMILIAFSSVSFLPILLLYVKRTRILGSILSVTIGSLPFVYILDMFYLYLTGASDSPDTPETFYKLLSFSYAILVYAMFLDFLFLAGILYFWQEKQKAVAGKDIIE